MKITTHQIHVMHLNSLQNSFPAFISFDSHNNSARWGHQHTLKEKTKVHPSWLWNPEIYNRNNLSLAISSHMENRLPCSCPLWPLDGDHLAGRWYFSQCLCLARLRLPTPHTHLYVILVSVRQKGKYAHMVTLPCLTRTSLLERR